MQMGDTIPASPYPPLKNDRILKAARGEKPDKLPIWIMRQAGRHLPEFREYRQLHTFYRICKTPELACDVTLMPINRYDLDAAIIFSDIQAIPKALGMHIQMEPSIGPILNPPLTLDDLNTLHYQGIKRRLKYVGDAIHLTRHKLGGKVPIFGFSGAPWTIMAYMIEGGASKTLNNAKHWLYSYPVESHKLLQLLTNVIIDYLQLQGRSGAQILQVVDSSAEHLNKRLYTTFCLPYLKQIRDELKKRLSQDIPLALFAKGAHYCLPEQADLGYDVIGIDWTVEPKVARELLKDKNVTIQGNLDPCALYAPKEHLVEIVKKMVQEFGSDRYIVSLGHGIYPDSDPRAVETLIETVHSIDI